MATAPDNELWHRLTVRKRPVKTPTVLQMEAVECGAAALGIVLGYYQRFVPLEELRKECSVSRDGSKASNVVRAAQKYGLKGHGYPKTPENLNEYPLPMILYWNFNHFLVLEGFSRHGVHLNDPAFGRRRVTYEEFDRSFTGIILTFDKTPEFRKGGEKHKFFPSLMQRLKGTEGALRYILLVGLGAVLTGLVIPSFSRILIDNILIGGQPWIVPLLIGMGLTAVLRGSLIWLQQFFLIRLETQLSISTSSKFLWHVLNLPVDFFNQRHAGDISARFALNDKLAGLLSGQLAGSVLNALLLVFYVVLMLQYDVTLTLVGIFIALLNVLALTSVSRLRVDSNLKAQQERGKLMGIMFNGLQIIETIKASGAETDFFARWGGHEAKALNAEQELGLATYPLNAVPPLLSTVTTAVVLGLGALHVMNGQLTIGMLVAFQSLMISFLAPINQLVTLGATFQEIEGDFNRLDDVFKYELDKNVVRNDVEVDKSERAIVSLNGHLELRHITFGYSPLAAPLIEDFNLVLKPGQRIALVGSSGSGKSTVAKLVGGLYEPWTGEILFDGKPREVYPRAVITNSMTVVDQDIALFEGTVRENITLWDSTIPQLNITQAAQDASIHEEISARLLGYEGHVEENGRNFSGGQRQRIEIARSLVNNPAILIMDEATSALDPLTEQRIDANLRRRGCTCLIIAHRLSTIRDCDEIIVLDHGKVVQRGTHEDMISVEGPYSKLMSSEEYHAEKSRTELLYAKLQ